MIMETLETDRLILTAWTKKDAEALFDYAKNPNVGPSAGWKPHSDPHESKRIIKDVFMRGDVWKIALKGSDKAIGSIGLDNDKRRPGVASRELGYSLSEEYWGRGLMTEAAAEVIRYAFEKMDMEILAVNTGIDNVRSQHVIEKLGFTYEGTERHSYLVYDSTVRDIRCYSMYRYEWEQLQQTE